MRSLKDNKLRFKIGAFKMCAVYEDCMHGEFIHYSLTLRELAKFLKKSRLYRK
jgi:hypothetical protein